MRKLSELAAAQWRERVGVGRMAEVPPVESEAERVSLGEGRKNLRVRDHAAIVYWSRAELLDTVIPYLKEGLRAGDKVVYVADDLTLDQLSEALDAAGVEVEPLRRQGRLTLTTAADAFFSGGRFDLEGALAAVRGLAEQAQREGYGRVRFSVEMTYLLAQVPGIEAGPTFEARANDEVFAVFPFVCICSFNGNRDVNNALGEVLATHPVLLSSGIPLTNPWYRPWTQLAASKERA